MDRVTKESTMINVLFLEDSPSDFEIICAILKDAGFDLKTERVEKEAEFEVELRRKAYDVVLADFKLPGFDAFSALRIAGEICPDTPFIVVSGSIGEETAIELIKNGADDYVIKDRPERLSIAIRRALEERKVRDERRQAEEGQQKAARFLQLLIDAIPNPIFYKDTQGFYRGCNRAFEAYIGSPREKVIGTSVYDVAPKELADKYHEMDMALFRQGGVQVYESKVRYADGTQHDVIFNKAVFTNTDGSPGGLVGVIIDISERKRMEEQLRFRNVLLTTQQETSIDGILVVDEDARILSYNRRFMEMWGLPEDLVEEGEDGPVLQFVTDQMTDPQLFFQRVRYLYDHKRETSRDELVLKDGRFFDRYSAPMFGPEEKYYGRIWYFRDITERKKAEEEIVLEQRRLESLLRISQQKTSNLYELYDFALEEAIHLSDSKIGYFYSYSEKTKLFTLHAWSKEVMKECTILEKQTVYELDKTGIWGEAVRQRKPILLNDFEAPHPLKKGYPEGHAPLKRYMTVPVFGESGIIAVVGVANKTLAYTENDVKQLTLLMDSVGKLAEKKMIENELIESEARYRNLFEKATEGIALLDADGNLFDVNEAFAKMHGYEKETLLKMNIRDIDSPLDSQLASGRIKRAMEGESLRDDLEHRHKDGFLFPLNVFLNKVEIHGNPYVMEFSRDMTWQKKAMEILKESEVSLKEAQILGRIGNWVYDRASKRRKWSDEVFVLYERDVELGTPSFEEESEYYSEEDARKLHGMAHTVCASGKEERMDVDVKLPGGKTAIFHIAIHPVKDASENVVQLHGTVQDITERKKNENELRIKNVLLATTLETAVDGIFVLDEHNRILAFNRRFIEMWEIPPDFREKTPEKQAAQIFLFLLTEPGGFLEKINYLKEHREETSSDEITLSDGRIFDRYSAPMFGSDGVFHGRVWFFREITERKLAEERIKNAANEWKITFDSIPEMISIHDTEYRLVRVNKAFADAFHMVPAEVVGKRCHEIVHGTDSPILDCPHSESLIKHQSVSREIFDSLLGRYLEVTVSPIYDGNGKQTASIHIAKDVTERKRMQDLMIQTEKMTMIGGLAAGMAHEINNPIGAMVQATQNVERRLSPDLPANVEAAQELGFSLDALESYVEKRGVRGFLKDIREAGERASRIVSNILQFSHPKDRKMSSRDVNDLLDRAIELAANDYDLKKKYDFRNIAIERGYDRTLPLIPMAAGEIEQVILNLLKNSAHAIMSRNSSVQPRITLTTGREGNWAVIRVTDNGCGMEEQVRRRVFEPFFTTKETGVGTGLGLSVSFTIVTVNHKGTIEVESEPEKGTSFIIRLPIENGA